MEYFAKNSISEREKPKNEFSERLLAQAKNLSIIHFHSYDSISTGLFKAAGLCRSS